MEIIIIGVIIFLIIYGNYSKQQEKENIKNLDQTVKYLEELANSQNYELTSKNNIDNKRYVSTTNTDLYYDKSGDYEASEKVGIEAESFVRSYLDRINYPKFHNFTFKHNNKIYKIDHILVTPNGCFVIETKRWRGEIKRSIKEGFVYVKTKKYGTKEYKDPVEELFKIKSVLTGLINGKKNQIKPVVMFVDSTAIELKTSKGKFFNNINEMMLYLKRKNKILERIDINNYILELNKLYHPISRDEYYSLKHN